MNISIKIPAKDTVFLKYLVTFVAQKQRKAFEELKKMKMHCLLCEKTQLSKNNSGKSTIFATDGKH